MLQLSTWPSVVSIVYKLDSKTLATKYLVFSIYIYVSGTFNSILAGKGINHEPSRPINQFQPVQQMY